jgi:L-arabinose isomerase
MLGLELLVIGPETRVDAFKKEIRWNRVSYGLADGL